MDSTFCQNLEYRELRNVLTYVYYDGKEEKNIYLNSALDVGVYLRDSFAPSIFERDVDQSLQCIHIKTVWTSLFRVHTSAVFSYNVHAAVNLYSQRTSLLFFNYPLNSHPHSNIKWPS